ncbi:MAG: hypothetical protein ACOCTM_04295 [Bacteroidota bacterium]
MNREQMIRCEIAKLVIAYPSAKRTMEEVDILVDMWKGDLEDLNENEIKEAIVEHRKKSVYFPTSADIRNQCDVLRRAFTPKQKTLPQKPTRLTEEERRKNKEHVRNLMKKLMEKQNNVTAR